MVEGGNQASRQAYLSQFQGGTVHLLSSANAASDADTTLSSDAQATTATGDWTITHDNTNGTSTLENTASIDFGSPSGFVIDQIAIQNPNDSQEFLIDNSPTGDTDLSGDGSTSLPASNASFTFGGE